MSDHATAYDFRLGIDLGGTKIEIVALDPAGGFSHRKRIPTPPRYDDTVEGIAGLVLEAEQVLGGRGSVGIGIPGVISPSTGLVKNANSIALNGHAFDKDLIARLARPVRVNNDANCFTLSEAADGAGVGHRVVFGVIVGTGCGGGLVVDGKLIAGPHMVTGEWGHTPLPWPKPEDLPYPKCWCGQEGCLERYISGTALAIDYGGPDARDAHVVVERAAAGEARAQAVLARHADRMGRGLAVIVNILDPDVIVLGGGLSNMDHLYEALPKVLSRHVFSDFVSTPIIKNHHGDSSGVRGACWLWPPPQPAA
ncbi:MAG: ROK family protein [Alphaproteobacteria bacterium]|nr:ROK family protein [Alphaproteobacteria bacterium]